MIGIDQAAAADAAPMENENIRSLNLAMTAGIVLYEALRQQI